MKAAEKAEWLGDRAQTSVYYFKDLSEVCELWGDGYPEGWVVPDKEVAKNGAKRKRLER